MAEKKISQLAAASALTGVEAMPLVQSATTKKATLTAIADFVRKVGSVQPPADPTSGSLWLSQSVRTLQVSDAAADRTTLLTGVAGGFENGFAQEPSVFWNPAADNWGMVYCGTSGIGYATAPNPAGPWTRRGKILGGGTGGFASVVSHARAFVVDDLLYLCFPDFGNNEFRITNGAALPTGTNAPVFTGNSVIFAPDIGDLGITANLLGNSKVLAVDESTFVLFWEAFETGVGWQMGTATCDTVDGTYTLGTFPLTTLRPIDAEENAVGGPMPFYEDGEFVLYYHGGGGPSTRIYRAFSAGTGDTWTIDNGGMPWLDKRLPNEVAQVADINIVASPSGAFYAFWDAINNNTGMSVGAGAINFAPVLLPLYLYDEPADNWAKVQAIPKTTPAEFDFRNLGSMYKADADVQNHELAVFDPQTADEDLVATLPFADVGARVRVANGSYAGSKVVTVAVQDGDVITAGAPTLGPGQVVTFYCFLPNNWSRDASVNNRGATDWPAGSAINMHGLFQKLQDGYVSIFASDGAYSNLDRRPGGANSTAYLDAHGGTIQILNKSATAPDIADGGTVATAHLSTSRYTPAGARTGLILEAGSYAGQTIAVINKSANTMTFAAAATSNVFTGTACVIAAGKAKIFVWDDADGRWHEV